MFSDTCLASQLKDNKHGVKQCMQNLLFPMFLEPPPDKACLCPLSMLACKDKRFPVTLLDANFLGDQSIPA